VRRRALPTIAALLLVASLGVVAAPGTAGAHPAHVAVHGGQPQDDPDGDPSTDDAPVPEQRMIPRPNSGHAPTDAGDRGGVLQGLVFLFIVAGVGGITALAVRESRRARASRVGGPEDRAARVDSGGR
jgi:hypothetical protein